MGYISSTIRLRLIHTQLHFPHHKARSHPHKAIHLIQLGFISSTLGFISATLGYILYSKHLATSHTQLGCFSSTARLHLAPRNRVSLQLATTHPLLSCVSFTLATTHRHYWRLYLISHPHLGYLGYISTRAHLIHNMATCQWQRPHLVHKMATSHQQGHVSK